MSDVSEAIVIAILVIVCLIFIFQIELYRNMLMIIMYNSPEAAPPLELRFSQSFTKTNKKESEIKQRN